MTSNVRRACPLVALIPLFLLGSPDLAAQMWSGGAEGPGHRLFPVAGSSGVGSSVVGSSVVGSSVVGSSVVGSSFHAPDRSVDGGQPAQVTSLVPLALAAQTARQRRGINFMIGGGVAVLVGSVVGGDGGTLLVLGGLASAGYGFYLYQDP